MARRTRAEIEGGLYHVITRGNNRRQIFIFGRLESLLKESSNPTIANQIETPMRFVNFEGIEKDKPTSELRVRGVLLDFHNEWNFIGYFYDIASSRMILRWRDVLRPEAFCCFEFNNVHSIRIEPSDRAYPKDESERLSMMIYQELEGEVPFMKFWFEDQSTIEIAADTLTLSLFSEAQQVIPVPSVQ